jgi:hypothetical protein
VVNSSFSYRILLPAIGLVFCCGFNGHKQEKVDCEAVFIQMFNAVKQVKTMRYNLSGVERIDDKYIAGHSQVKLNVSPIKIYFKNGSGIEVLYPNEVEGEALVNPNGFPYFNMHLDIDGKLMRKNQHHLLTHLGYAYFSSVLYHSFSQFPDVYKKYVSCAGDTIWDGQPCYKMNVNFTNYECSTYTVSQAKETVSTIATKYYVNEYELLILNHLSWYYDELKVGTTILLPNSYAKNTTLFIRKDLLLPVVIRVYDDKGLLEEYCYSNLQINSSISNDEFSENFSDYHF